MRRRDFITAVGGAATWPFAARAQSPTMPIIGIIDSAAAGDFPDRLSAFRAGLGEAGYVDGRNVVIDYHGLKGRSERIPAVLADLIQRRVAVIATPWTPAAIAAKTATATIPIVFGVSEDPVALGIVASLARPGGNATGINFFVNEIDAKRLSLMQALMPNAKRYAVLINPADATATRATTTALQTAASILGLDIHFLSAGNPAEVDAAFAAASHDRSDALFIGSDGFFASRAPQFAMLAARYRMPASFSTREMAEAGLLMSFGVDFVDVFRRVGSYAGRILKGAKPADLPVQQPTKFVFAINKKTAAAFGLDVPTSLLATADEVIE